MNLLDMKETLLLPIFALICFILLFNFKYTEACILKIRSFLEVETLFMMISAINRFSNTSWKSCQVEDVSFTNRHLIIEPWYNLSYQFESQGTGVSVFVDFKIKETNKNQTRY